MMRFLIFFSLFLSGNNFAGDTIMNTITQNSISQNTLTQASTINQASIWGLNEAEWKRYTILMQGPSGKYYPNLTPLEVLGINAENPEDLKHFSELTASQEHAKIERELRFNAAFQSAAQRLYSHEPVIRPFDYSPYSTNLK